MQEETPFITDPAGSGGLPSSNSLSICDQSHGANINSEPPPPRCDHAHLLIRFHLPDAGSLQGNTVYWRQSRGLTTEVGTHGTAPDHTDLYPCPVLRWGVKKEETVFQELEPERTGVPQEDR